MLNRQDARNAREGNPSATALPYKDVPMPREGTTARTREVEQRLEQLPRSPKRSGIALPPASMQSQESLFLATLAPWRFKILFC